MQIALFMNTTPVMMVPNKNKNKETCALHSLILGGKMIIKNATSEIPVDRP